MAEQFVIPEVGSLVTATVTRRHYSGYGTINETFTGPVVPINKWEDGSRVFAINDGNPDWPVHTIPIDWVTDLKYNDGTAAATHKVASGVQTWTVDGSKPGTKYTVTKQGNKVTCSCPGYGFRRTCKHVAIAK